MGEHMTCQQDKVLDGWEVLTDWCEGVFSSSLVVVVVVGA